MSWVKANDFVFKTEEVVAVGPIESMPAERVPPNDEVADTRARVVLKAGSEFYLKGAPAQRFRERFLAELGSALQDFDSIQVNETRILRASEGAFVRPAEADG